MAARKEPQKAKMREVAAADNQLLRLMSEVISLRERVMQAELIASRPKLPNPDHQGLPSRRGKGVS